MTLLTAIEVFTDMQRQRIKAVLAQPIPHTPPPAQATSPMVKRLPPHGTVSRYFTNGCRCGLCREASREYRVQRILRHP